MACRAVGAGVLAFGSKAAALLKGAGGAGSLAKGVGGLAIGGAQGGWRAPQRSCL